MKRILTIVAVLALVFGLTGISIMGCGATAAQQRAAQIRKNITTVLANVNTCSKGVREKPIYQPIFDRMAIGNLRSPTLLQLTDNGFPNDDQVALIYSMHNDMAHCRENLIKELMNIDPGPIPIITMGWQANDIVLSDLITRKITFGEANKRRATLVNEVAARLNDYGNQLGRDLAAAHNAEIQHREAAFSALAQWSQQQQMLIQNQQMINAINRPVTTNCFRIGNSVQCTSY